MLPKPVPGTLVLLDTITLGSDNQVTFSSIDQSYQDLVVELLCQGARGGAITVLTMLVNGDTGSNYRHNYLQAGQGSASPTNYYAASVLGYGAVGPLSITSSGKWTKATLEIPDYADTGKSKTIETRVSTYDNTNGTVSSHGTILYDVAAAVTSLLFDDAVGLSGLHLKAGSRADLYGRGPP